ncbi:MAG TPA: 2-oxoacid:ferredoxin oxidoreductase subunit beta [Ignisphaera sp.]|nr:2-oxoacid:ferredoxin oxidoreductase subunit beta [Ignisphaera sp.]
MIEHPSLKYVRREVLPTAFCPGCYNGIVMNALFKAFEELGIYDLKNFVFVSGIGCSSWIPSPYIKADSIHTLHGRAIAVATGVKLAKPHLEVVVIAGDGDIASIGGNHLLHAARRNMDLIVVMISNLVYGMTRGQQAPTTPIGMRTATTPYGNPEPPIDMARLLVNTNANYVAKWCVSNFVQLKESFKEAIEMKRGFRFVEVYAPCITYVVRYEGKTAGQKLKELMKICTPIKTFEKLPPEEKINRIVVGVFKREDKPGYVELYNEYVKKAQRSM